MIERHRDELADVLPEVDLFLGASEMDQLDAAPAARRGLIGDSVTAHPGVRGVRRRLAGGALPENQRRMRSRLRVLRDSIDARKTSPRSASMKSCARRSCSNSRVRGR